MARRRPIPVVFRISATILLVALVGGHIWQRQPAGVLTRSMLAYIARTCPSAAYHGEHPVVVDGAHAVDRMTFRLLADRIAPRTVSRCGRTDPRSSGDELLHGKHGRASKDESRSGRTRR